MFTLETTSGSLLHLLARSHRETSEPPISILRAYLLAVAATYLPLLVTALTGPLPASAQTATLHLPFFFDWNVAFMFLVSFPSLIAFTVSDQQVLSSSLQRVQIDGIVSLTEADEALLKTRWEGKFRAVNLRAQALGVGFGLLLSIANALIYKPLGFWIADQGKLLPVGYMFLYCIFIFYALIPIYVLRSIAISSLLRDLVAHAEIRMLPFHPDHCAGLRPVGRLGLRNQYLLTMFGLNVVLLVVVSKLFLPVPPALYGLIFAAVIAYLFLGPLVFIGPLLPFRIGMLRTKAELMSEIAQRLRVELRRIRSQLASGAITKDDEELIERLRKIGGLVDELPVWPFDAGTLRKFLTAYIAPLLSAALPLLRAYLGPLLRWLRA